ncbi:MAG TPA: glycosyltransferase family 4 protein [Terriglobales bacterium]|nr:glycosyltransferase family 4 protein [Terriglobales bacterium]
MSPQALRICFLTYRGNPSCGGQGIYTRRLTRELAALGHDVEVWSGPPYPELDDAVRLRRIASLDLWSNAPPLRRPSWSELRDPIAAGEWLRTITGTFAEPLSFSRRVARAFSQENAGARFDLVHDNQSLGAGLLRLRRTLPVVATIHHPITVDRDIAVASAEDGIKRWGVQRWYSFVGEQQRVAPALDRIVTVSQVAAEGIAKDFKIRPDRLRVVANGVDIDRFRPLSGTERSNDCVVSTISANAPLKGLPVLLDAVAQLRRTRPRLRLTVIGKDGHAATKARIRELGLGEAVHFTGRLTTEEMVEHYARASLAVVPSLYEGFGLPAIEAMACEVPVIASNAGALPEVVGEDGAAGLLVPAGDAGALAATMAELLAAPLRARTMGEAGRRRVQSLFTWRRAAEMVVEVYRELLCARRSEGGC